MLSKDLSSPLYSIPKSPRESINRKDKELAEVGPFNYRSTFYNRRNLPRYSIGIKLESSLISPSG